MDVGQALEGTALSSTPNWASASTVTARLAREFGSPSSILMARPAGAELAPRAPRSRPTPRSASAPPFITIAPRRAFISCVSDESREPPTISGAPIIASRMRVRLAS